MTSDPRLPALKKALERFTERLGWLCQGWSPEESTDLSEVRTILGEWSDLEPHLELLEAIVGRSEMAQVTDWVEKARARVQVAFLFAVRGLIFPLLLRRLNEELLRMPGALSKKVPPELEPQKAQLREQLESLIGTLPDLETMFRQSMQAADNCEEASRKAYVQMINEWPDDWTDAMQARLEKLTLSDARVWLDEVEAKQRELITQHPWMVR